MSQSMLVVLLMVGASVCTASLRGEQDMNRPDCGWLFNCRGDIECLRAIVTLNPDCRMVLEEVLSLGPENVKRASFEDKRQGKKFRNIALNSYLNPLKG